MTRADEIDLHKRVVEATMEDYRQDLIAYAKFMEEMDRKYNPKREAS